MRGDEKKSSTRVVSFSGIDGSGKSTQIDCLREKLKEAGFRVTVIRFWDDVATLKPIRKAAAYKIFHGDPGVGSPNAPIERRDKNVHSPFLTCVRLCIYMLDAFSLRATLRRTKSDGVDVIIADRYIYDEVANLNLRNPLLRKYLKVLLNVASRPEIAFLIDADPETARRRKPEYPLAFLIDNRDSYLRLAKMADDFRIIPPLDLQEAEAEVWGHVASCFCDDPALKAIA